ncbi:hypothetical protein SB781_31565, partial [Paraburkholderia sp. SIMBA_061]
FYLRKMRATVFLSSPSIMNLDSRIRGVTTVYCQVVKEKQSFRYHMYDLQSEKFLRTYRISKEKAFGISGSVYDSTKMVIPLEYPSKKEEFDRIVNLLKETNDNYYTA